MSTVFFPLRSSVELFGDGTSPDAVTRVKEAALLYDVVIFEGGLLDATFTPTGTFHSWAPPEGLTPELLAQSRRPIPLGERVTVAFGKQPSRGVPASPEAMRVFIDDQLSVRFVAEFHSEIMNELAKLDAVWARMATFGPSDQPRDVAAEVVEAIRAANHRDRLDRELLRDQEQMLRKFIYESFNRDSVLAAAMEASFVVTPLFQPMLARHGVVAERPGSEALDLLVPNVGALPWEAVLEFREHPGAAEARDKLREFERRAAEEEPEDAIRFLKQVAREVNAALLGTVQQLAPSLPEALGKEMLLTMVSVSTAIGPVLEKVAAVAGEAKEAREFRRSWISALMTLRVRPPG